MNPNELLLVDLSAIARPIWEMAQASSNARASVADGIVQRVQALAMQHRHAAICCDSGKCFRHDLAPDYKGQRPERDAAMLHQFNLAAEALRADGFPVWSVRGFEADDLIASAVVQALAVDGDVLIASSDKDLLAMVGAKVRYHKTTDGSVLTVESVIEKLGVSPSQVLDYLSLVGDKSDNVTGARGIGAVKAAKLLQTFGSLDQFYAALDNGDAVMTNGDLASLTEFRERLPLVRQLLGLRTDVELPFHEISVEREVKPMSALPPMFDEPFEDDARRATPPAPTAPPAIHEGAPAPINDAGAIPSESNGGDSAPAAAAMSPSVIPYSQALVVHGDWNTALEPRSLPEALQLANHMFKSRLFGAYGTPEGVFATILAGRELGLPAMSSLRSFHVIDNKPSPSADLLAALVMRSGKAKYFRCVERTPERATFETQRLPVEDYPPQRLSFTIAEAKASWRKDEKAWMASGWGKTPAAMLVARAKSALARLEYPDVVGNLYAPEELD